MWFNFLHIYVAIQFREVLEYRKNTMLKGDHYCFTEAFPNLPDSSLLWYIRFCGIAPKIFSCTTKGWFGRHYVCASVCLVERPKHEQFQSFLQNTTFWTRALSPKRSFSYNSLRSAASDRLMQYGRLRLANSLIRSQSQLLRYIRESQCDYLPLKYSRSSNPMFSVN